MAKFYGTVGYKETKETKPGVWKELLTEHRYYGDVIQVGRSLENSGGVNDNLNVNVKISILADPFAYENFHSILYVEWMRAKWKVTNVEPQYPRLILTIGGLYNDQRRTQTESADEFENDPWL